VVYEIMAIGKASANISLHEETLGTIGAGIPLGKSPMSSISPNSPQIG